jgi:hypothetical protein
LCSREVATTATSSLGARAHRLDDVSLGIAQRRSDGVQVVRRIELDDAIALGVLP